MSLSHVLDKPTPILFYSLHNKFSILFVNHTYFTLRNTKKRNCTVSDYTAPEAASVAR